MTATQRAALIAAFLAGTAGGATSVAALLREAPGQKTYFTTDLALQQVANPDGGLSDVLAIARGVAAVNLNDGGTGVVTIDPAECQLSPANKTTLRNILVASEACLRNAP